MGKERGEKIEGRAERGVWRGRTESQQVQMFDRDAIFEICQLQRISSKTVIRSRYV
jgi:hypothetical protein